MAAVVGDDDGGLGTPRDLGDVRVVDAAAGDRRRAPRRAGAGSARAAGRSWTRHPREDLFLDQPRRVAGRQAEFGGQPGRDRVELQAAVPRGRRAARGLLGDGVQQRLCAGALCGPKSISPASRTLVSRKTLTASGSALPRSAPRCRPRAGRRLAPSAARPAASRSSPASVPARRARSARRCRRAVTSSAVPGVSPARVTDRRRNHHPACLVDGGSHGIRIPCAAASSARAAS